VYTFPWTTACSPKTITFPGAETMKAGIIGVDCLRLICDAGLCLEPLEFPFRCVCLRPLLMLSTLTGIVVVGDVEGVLVEGVKMESSIELDLEEVRLRVVPDSLFDA